MEIFNVSWQKYNENELFIIGYLIHDNKWYFKYNDEIIDKAITNGFRPFPDMPELKKIYESFDLFPTFSMRYRKYGSHLFIENMKNNDASLVTDKILIKYLKGKRKI